MSPSVLQEVPVVPRQHRPGSPGLGVAGPQEPARWVWGRASSKPVPITGSTQAKPPDLANCPCLSMPVCGLDRPWPRHTPFGFPNPAWQPLLKARGPTAAHGAHDPLPLPSSEACNRSSLRPPSLAPRALTKFRRRRRCRGDLTSASPGAGTGDGTDQSGQEEAQS